LLSYCDKAFIQIVFSKVVIAQKEGLQEKILLLQSFFGIANVIGTLCFGSIVKSRSQDCLISRQYLLQASLFGIGKCKKLNIIFL